MKMAILTTKNQWFESYADALSEKLGNILIFNNHVDIKSNYDVIFILSYHEIIPQEYLKKNKHNLVVHESALPKGKGWAPLFWQVLEGEGEIPFTMIEASNRADNGDIYMQEILELANYELNEVLRDKQANMIIQMCVKFVNNYEKYKTPVKQNGGESFYKKRDKKDSKLNIDKTIRDQFNLFRVVNNNDYPAYFELDGHRYILKIELDKPGKGGIV
jgi:methionyl-tRNA formyltransferase